MAAKQPVVRDVFQALEESRTQATLDYSKHPTLTKQSMRRECDINEIVARHRKISGMDPALGGYAPGLEFGDFSDVPSYQDALERVHSADAQFMSLPATVRAKFSNDPAQFLRFASDPKNLDEMRELGLARPKDDMGAAAAKAASPSPAPSSSPTAKPGAASEGSKAKGE